MYIDLRMLILNKCIYFNTLIFFEINPLFKWGVLEAMFPHCFLALSDPGGGDFRKIGEDSLFKSENLGSSIGSVIDSLTDWTWGFLPLLWSQFIYL